MDRKHGTSTHPRPHTPHQAESVTGDEVVGIGPVSAAAAATYRLRWAPRREAEGGCVALTGGRFRGSITRPRARSPARRAARGPELAQLAAELLSGRGPVAADVVSQILHMAFQVQLVLLEPADVEVMPRGAPLQLPVDVFFVVAHDSVVGKEEARKMGVGCRQRKS